MNWQKLYSLYSLPNIHCSSLFFAVIITILYSHRNSLLALFPYMYFHENLLVFHTVFVQAYIYSFVEYFCSFLHMNSLVIFVSIIICAKTTKLIHHTCVWCLLENALISLANLLACSVTGESPFVSIYDMSIWKNWNGELSAFGTTEVILNGKC